MTRVHTASFYEPQHWIGQAVRVSRQHPRGLKAQWDILPFAYPTAELVKAYRSGQMTFEAFMTSYRRLLEERWKRDPDLQEWIQQLVSREDVTLLCFERESEPCHRRELARWLHEKEPRLELGMLQ